MSSWTRAAVWTLHLAVGVSIVACASDGNSVQPTDSSPVDATADASPDVPGDTAPMDSGTEDSSDALSPPVTLTVFHTSDEHGWLQPVVDTGVVYGGVANFFGRVKAEGFDSSRDLLVSSGDNWTGQAISTLFQGKPVVEAFNYMGYAATAIGNHDFDFGTAVLAERAAESDYAYLSANLRDQSTGTQPAYALPFRIVQVQGVDVGLIGVTTPATATATNPKNVSGLAFDDVAATLQSLVPQVRAKGAKVVLVLAHYDAYYMDQIAENLTVPVDAIFTGHDHGSSHDVVNGIPVIGSGWALQGYSVTRLRYDPVAGATTFVDTRFQPVSYPESAGSPVPPDQGLLDLVDGWQQQLDAQLGEEIGYTETGIPMGWQQGNWVTDAWLWAFPEADVALENFGGLRQPVAPGAIKLEDLFGMMPFENGIYELELTGAQLRQDLSVGTTSCAPGSGCYLAVAGVTYKGVGSAISVSLPGGAPLDPSATYRVLVNDYMYAAGPYPLSSQDPSPVDLGVNFRDPVVSWTRQLHSSPSDPLEAHLDPTPRDQ